MLPRASRKPAGRLYLLIPVGLLMAAPAVASTLACEKTAAAACEEPPTAVCEQSQATFSAGVARAPAALSLRIRPQVSRHLLLRSRQAQTQLEEALERRRPEIEWHLRLRKEVLSRLDEQALKLHLSELEKILEVEVGKLEMPVELNQRFTWHQKEIASGPSHPLTVGIHALVALAEAPAKGIVLLQKVFITSLKLLPKVLRLLL
ncbi:MAG: hypothetical protein ACE5HV_03805 [Acidobacteriota bacterium]